MALVKKKLTIKVDLPIKIKLPESFTSEPLFLLLKNIKLTDPWVIFAIAFIVGFLDDVIIGASTGYWNSRPGVVGVFDANNIPPLIMSLIVEPGVWAFFVGFPPALFELFKAIQERGILLTEQENAKEQGELPTQEENVQEQVDRLRRIMSSWLFLIAVIPLAFGIAYYAMLIVGEYQPTPWFYLGWHYWLRFARIVGSAYVTVYAIAWSLLALFTLYGVFSSAKVKVNAYDSDNAGGLRFIGTFILKVSRLALIVVPLLVAETLFALRLGRGILGQFNFWLEIIILPLLLAVMVSMPLIAVRRAMFAAKDEFLNPLRDKIQDYILQTYPPHQTSKPQLEEITALIDFQTKLRKDYPTWPFDMSMSQQIGISFFLSLLPIVFSIIQQVSSNFAK